MLASSRSRQRQIVLRGVVICATSSEDAGEDAKVEEQAGQLGAHFTKEVTTRVTHLICDKAGSPKHRKICERNAGLKRSDRVIVVTKAWLQTCVNASLRVSPQPYILPPLTSMELCCSSLQAEEKGHIEKIATDLGAGYTKILNMKCTHLITETPAGKKYDFAFSIKKMKIVRPKWIHECARLNVLLDEAPFLLAPQEEDANAGPHALSSMVNPTIADTASRMPSQFIAGVPGGDQDDSAPTTNLDALRVYLTESPFRDADKHAPLRARALRLLALAFATAVPEAQPYPNFIVVLRVPIAPSTIPQIKDAVDTGVPITTLQWLQDCVEQDEILPHERYTVPNWQSADGLGGGRSSSDGLGLSQSQSQGGALASSTFQGCRVSLGALWLRDEKNCGEVERQLISGRAKVLPHDNSGVATAGVPTHVVCASDLQSRERLLLDSVKRVNERVCGVTPFWVDSCTATQKLLSVAACVLFRPLPYGTPLRDMVEQRVSVTLSGFQRREEGEWNRRREVLSRLVELLGAKYSEKMRRRGTTHVVADNRVKESDKVRKAREWGIKVVSHEWLLVCAKAGKVVAEECFRVAMKTSSGETEEADADADEGEMTQMGKRGEQAGLQITPRRSPRVTPSKRAGGASDAKEGSADAAAINLFKRLTEGLEERDGNGDLDDSLENGGAHAGEGDEGPSFLARRSRSVSRDAVPGDQEWSMDASQSQVIVHRDLTPPPTPRPKVRSMPARAVKRPRASE